jgi:hypothetical protein
MKRRIKPIVDLVCGAILLSGVLCPWVQAQSVVISSSTSTLAPSVIPIGGYGANPQEYLVVSWSVTENTVSDVYTYSYTVKNPAGDVLLNPNGTLTSTPEVVDYYEVDFNTTANGALVGTPPTPSGGGFVDVTGGYISWSFPEVNAGGASSLLTFQSDLGPGSGNASANDGDPPSPWASTGLNGQQVPIPTPISTPEPTTTALLLHTATPVPFLK